MKFGAAERIRTSRTPVLSRRCLPIASPPHECLVGPAGVAPARLSALVPKTRASAIPPGAPGRRGRSRTCKRPSLSRAAMPVRVHVQVLVPPGGFAPPRLSASRFELKRSASSTHGGMKFGALGGTCTLKSPGKNRELCYYSFEREFLLVPPRGVEPLTPRVKAGYSSI